jgi:hypothetical protein
VGNHPNKGWRNVAKKLVVEFGKTKNIIQRGSFIPPDGIYGIYTYAYMLEN